MFPTFVRHNALMNAVLIFTGGVGHGHAAVLDFNHIDPAVTLIDADGLILVQ